jgi:predicted RNase H-like HicB family nuclease
LLHRGSVAAVRRPGRTNAAARGQPSELANEPLAAYRIRMKTVKLPVVIRPGEDGWIVVECPLIPGCISQGETHDEALANIREAIELCLENRESEGWSLPSEYEVVNVDVDVAA